MPPAGPFLSGQKGAKEPVKAGDSDFPRLNNPPLETAKKGELRFPLLGTSPKSFYRLLSGGGGLLRNAPAAPACMRGGWNVGAGLVPARRGFPQRRGIEATTRAAPTVAQNRERICRYPVRSSGRRVVISLPPVYTTVSERFFLTFHPVEGVW